ncbi:DUF4937 domain-containing protein [Streptomyces sp. AB3(2024)]|uniref:DUF4937 domain-containing protein n=1 Tax=Streptomyces sp. AB3(2024) TaxID=3317321 RepID=UPI0035A3D1E7
MRQVGGWDPATGRAHVLGLWSDAGSYRRFMEERHDRVFVGHLPALRARAGLREDLHSMTGHLIPLEPDWRVLPVPAVAAG